MLKLETIKSLIFRIENEIINSNNIHEIFILNVHIKHLKQKYTYIANIKEEERKRKFLIKWNRTQNTLYKKD